MANNLLNKYSPTFLNLLVSAIAILSISIALLYTAHRTADKTLSIEIQKQEKRLHYQTEQKLKQLDLWRAELTHQGNLFVNDPIIREYTTRIETAGGNLSDLLKPLTLQDRVSMNQQTIELAIQIPLMQNTLKEFARFAGFISGRILNGSGAPIIATNMMLPPLTPEQNKLIETVSRFNTIQFSPLRKSDNRLEIDICLPIYPPDLDTSTVPVGFLLLTKEADSTVSKLLSPSPISSSGEQTILVQKIDNKFYSISPNLDIERVYKSISFNNDVQLLFSNRTSILDSSNLVYSVGKKEINNGWWIIQEIEVNSVSEQIKQAIQATYAVAWLGIASTSLVTILIWWVLLGVQRKKIARNFKTLAHQVDEQQQFIHSINTSINDFITLKDLNGKFIYTNKAFNVAVGKTPDELIGLSCSDVFGPDTANRLEASDHLVLDRKQKLTITEPIVFHNDEFYFQISKSPYLDKDRITIGIVEVYRDITGFLEIQRKNEFHNIKTIEALNSTIKAVDPHLSGHARILSFLAEQVGETLQLSDSQKKHLVTAANLSQIGKAFIPKEILTKPNQLTEQEIKIVQKHVQHGLQLLRESEVDEHILTIIHQMHEKLDGSGYPQQLTETKIVYNAKILGPLNVFCALIQPRAYRQPVTIDKAISLLLNQSNCFDIDIIKALKQITDKKEIRDILNQTISELT